MKHLIESIHAYSKYCVGCRRNERDIMLSFISNKSKRIDGDVAIITDLFLTQAQAESLHKELGEMLARNKER